ncbi:TetR/AcrR family transcriptional regulator [Rhodococcus sp. ARC_M6]|uniref:TetR/AcrR family transcriptional regulator n=1 Tax=Rhodococcus sp. ARC_M6 TaxID=2928852 RepID=UPI001FB30DCC|nr:TetR/AcrR family transcriptional regulator [Rhodococcus sp. ARC_M6]MCJ0903289.1 TetR/AcrR family transcriptional regulator [Rhodococcus sp. ARC_M6]
MTQSGTAASGTRQRRSQARINRNRIIEAAISAFAADPDASMDDVAKAAGVVRRTVYAHFESREALINGIVDEASADLVTALQGAGEPPERPDVATAVLALLAWPVGDRFRVLLNFARRELGEQRIFELMEPARALSVEVMERGQRDGTFSTYLPAETLVAMTEAITITLFDQANSGVITDSGESFAIACLVLAGISPDRSVEVVVEAATWIRESTTGSRELPTPVRPAD